MNCLLPFWSLDEILGCVWRIFRDPDKLNWYRRLWGLFGVEEELQCLIVSSSSRWIIVLLPFFLFLSLLPRVLSLERLVPGNLLFFSHFFFSGMCAFPPFYIYSMRGTSCIAVLLRAGKNACWKYYVHVVWRNKRLMCLLFFLSFSSFSLFILFSYQEMAKHCSSGLLLILLLCEPKSNDCKKNSFLPMCHAAFATKLQLNKHVMEWFNF